MYILLFSFLIRYPDPLHMDLKQSIADYRRVRPEQIFLGVGSDEVSEISFVSCKISIINSNYYYSRYSSHSPLNICPTLRRLIF
jgi:histidinol-phosphate/aromatic aminotransferase/cobyric acid decarboxylase-like protein